MPTFSLVADYCQFYLFDEGASPRYPEDITDADVLRQFKAVPNLVAVYTDAATEFAITVECDERPRELNPSSWAHIVEGPLNVPSGRVVLASPSSELAHAPAIAVKPGAYRVRVAVPHNSEAGRRCYLVCLWPSALATVEVIKPSVQRAA